MGDSRDLPTAVESPSGRSVEPRDTTERPLLGQRFTERGELGRGGMGRVALAHDNELGREVAIKQVLSIDETDRARFEREARITARLQHPGIVPLYDAGRDAEGKPFYVMKRVTGRPLDEVVEATPAAEATSLVPCVLAACDAIAFAHARGILHRDIKPPNILVGEFGETLVIDWGLARAIDEDAPDTGTAANLPDDLTRAGTVAGTPGFMAPEQARGDVVDRRADVYALGATLFYVLAGEPPFANLSSGTEMIAHAALDRHADYAKLPADVPADLRAIVTTAMAPDPAKRYADAAALAADLRRYVTGKLVHSHRYGVRERLVRWVKRHRAAVAVGAIALAALVVVSIVSIGRIVEERDLAEAARVVAVEKQAAAQLAADEQLVQRARELAIVDPLAAVSELRTLRDGSVVWRDAAMIIESARLRGVPHGWRLDAIATAAAVSADGSHALTVDQRGGIVTYDLVLHTARVVPRLPPAPDAKAAWFGDRVVRATADTVASIDPATGEQRALPHPGGEIAALYGGTELLAWSDTGLARLVDGARWESIATDVIAVAASHDVTELVIATREGFAYWSKRLGRRVEIPNPFDHPPASYALAMCVRDESFAIAMGDRIHYYVAVLEGVTFQGTKRERTDRESLACLGKSRFVIEESNVVKHLERSRSDLQPSQDNVRMWTTANGAIVLKRDRSYELHDPKGSFTLGGPRFASRFVWSPDGRFVFGFSTEQPIAVAWDVGAMRPTTVAIPDFGLGWITPQGYWLRDEDATLRLVGQDGAVRAEHREASHLVSAAFTRDGLWSTVRTAEMIAVVDRTTGARLELPGARHSVAEETGVLVADQAGVVRFYDTTSPTGREVATLPPATTGFLHDPSVPARVVAFTPKTMTIIDLATKATTSIGLPEEADAAIITPSRELWVIAGGIVYRLRGTTFEPVPAEQRCESFDKYGDTLLVQCEDSMYRVTASGMRLIGEGIHSWRTQGDRFASLNEGGDAWIGMAASEIAVRLPRLCYTRYPVLVHADRVACTTTDEHIVEWTFGPAVTEADLHVRMATMTNTLRRGRGPSIWPSPSR